MPSPGCPRSSSPVGVMYVSFKRGEGEGVRGDRHFTDFTTETLRVELQACEPLEVISIWETADVRPDRGAEMWLNALARKRLIQAAGGVQFGREP